MSGHTHDWEVQEVCEVCGDRRGMPAVLLRDTPEDRERLAAALHKRNDGVGVCWGDHLPVSIRRPNPKPTDCESDADAIIAALRGDR